jgi:hypothetical protein
MIKFACVSYSDPKKSGEENLKTVGREGAETETM